MNDLMQVRVDIVKGGANGDLIVPDLAEALAAGHVAIVVPAVSIQTDTELEDAVIIDGGGNVVLLVDLDTVEPDLEVTGVVGLPVDLEDDSVPHSSTDCGKVGAGDDVAAAVGLAVVAVDVAAVELVVLDPEHAGGHPVVATAAGTGAVGDELGNVVRLRLELPVLRETESKAVELLLAADVTAVVVYLGVVAVLVAGSVGLGHLESRVALEDDVGDLGDGSLVLVADKVPAVEVAIIVEASGGAGRRQDSQDGGEDGLDSNHFGGDCLF